MIKYGLLSIWIKVRKWGVAEVPVGIRWAVFVIFVALLLLWFSGYFGF